jgi:clan AA aspartic protease (TIGR02281 family)
MSHRVLTISFVIGLLFMGVSVADAESIALKQEGGTFVVPVLINDKITLNFTVDSGAADVSIPADVFSTLIRAGTVAKNDLMDTRVYQLADGSQRQSQRFRIRSLRVGSLELRDVVASVAPPAGILLLGQSFLARLGSWSIDNQHQVLVINELPILNTTYPSSRTDDVAPPSQWVSFSTTVNDDRETFVDVSSIRVSDGIRRAWLRSAFAPHAKGAVWQRKRTSYELMRDAINCGEETFRL